MNRALVRFEGQVMALLHQSGFAEVRIAHLGVTRNLDFKGTRANELAQRAGMTRQAIGELIDQCEALGLVRRVPDPSDGRAKMVHFTKHGHAFMTGLRQALEEAQAVMLAEVGPDRMATMLECLHCYTAEAPSREALPAPQEASNWSRPRRRHGT